MLKILALQAFANTASEGFADADSNTSVTCTGCSCASNVCTSGAVQVAEIPTLD